MPTAWRIVKRRDASTAFEGEGARLFGGRWNSSGTAVVYVSASRALAMLEVLAGLGGAAPMGAYLLIPARFDDALVETHPEFDQVEVGPEEAIDFDPRLEG